MSFSTSRELSFTCNYPIYFQGKHNIPVPYLWCKRRVQFLSYTTPKSELDYTIQNVYTGVHWCTPKKTKSSDFVIKYYCTVAFSTSYRMIHIGTCALKRGKRSQMTVWSESGNLRLEPNILAYIVFLVSSYIRLFRNENLSCESCYVPRETIFAI